jgi:hypothetical protein
MKPAAKSTAGFRLRLSIFPAHRETVSLTETVVFFRETAT